jgi:hypothetical protein
MAQQQDNSMDIDKLKHKLEEAITPHIPMIKAQVHSAAQRSGEKAASYLQNDQAMTVVLGQVHGRLPRPLRWVIKEEKFVRFMLANRDKFLSKDET